jgi:hypothetical protein
MRFGPPDADMQVHGVPRCPAMQHVKDLKALTTLSSGDAEKRRRYYAARKCNPMRTLIVVGKTVRPIVDPAAHAAVESGAGFTEYTGVVKAHVVRIACHGVAAHGVACGGLGGLREPL